MELQRQEYPSMLKTLQPSQAVRVLTDRIQYIRSVNNNIAEWLQERRRIEEQYSTALRKLASKQFSQESIDLGVFTTPWQKIVTSTESLASSHQTFARSIESEVEQPLRAFAASGREMTNMENIKGNIEHIAKEVDAAQKKAEKLNSKGGKAAAEKVASAASEIEDAQGQWDSQAPYVFERLQEVDELRLELLQKCLTQFQTFADETKNSASQSLEECLNSLLNVQAVDEIQHFAMKAPGSTSATRERRLSRPGQLPVLSESSTLAPPSIPTQFDAASDRSSIKGSPAKENRKSTFGGLKRLGTVIKGRRHSQHPYGQPLQSPERKRSSTSLASKFPSFTKKSRDYPEALSPQPTGTSQTSERRLSAVRPSERETGPSLERAISSHSNILPGDGSPEPMPALVNGNHVVESPRETENAVPETSSSLPATVIEEPETENNQQGSDAITQAMHEAAAVSEGSQPQFKLDIKDAPIQEEDGDASATMLNVASVLRAQATPRRNVTTRGRRDRNTIILPSASTPEMPNIAAAASNSSSSLPNTPPPAPLASSPTIQPTQFKAPLRSSTLGTEDATASDTHSIRSGRSLSSTISNTIRHPEMPEPGLNASIVETVSAWFTAGSCTRAIQIGEIALVYNSHDSSEPSGTETIRFNHFNSLEKVAPNPLFIDAVSGKDGNYTVNLSHIPRTSIAFKYQVHLDADRASTFAPLRLVPAWKVEASQTLVMLSYSLNPAFASKLPPDTNSITLSNVILSVTLDPSAGKIVRCQAQGGGSYARERHLVYWRLHDMTLTKDVPAQVLRARFMTEGEVKPGNAEARWELADSLGAGDAGISLSRLETGAAESGDEAQADPFADEGAATPMVNWGEVQAVRRLRSGTYMATSE